MRIHVFTDKGLIEKEVYEEVEIECRCKEVYKKSREEVLKKRGEIRYLQCDSCGYYIQIRY